EEASAARAAGFRCAKVKVGLGDDTGRVAAVRAAAGPDMRIRLDANGAWSADEALAALDALAPTQIELCEEPTSGLEATGRAAAVLRPDRSCGLATLGLFDGRPDVLPVSEGLMGLPAGPGLGDGLLGWYGAS